MSIPTPGSILFCIAAVTLGFVMVTATGCQREADVAKSARTKGGKTAPSHKGTEKSAKKAFVFLSPKERRAAFERCKTLSAKSLGVREPIEVVESDIYADGGTITLKFRDATKHEFAAKLPTQWNYKPGEKVPYFFGPGEKSLKKLPFGGREEPTTVLVAVVGRSPIVDDLVRICSQFKIPGAVRRQAVLPQPRSVVHVLVADPLGETNGPPKRFVAGKPRKTQ